MTDEKDEQLQGGGNQPTRNAAGVILVFACLVFGPVIVRELPRELGRWYYAAAWNAWQEGDTEGADRALEQAIYYHGPCSEFLLLRAELHGKRQNHAAAEADLDLAIELAPHDKRIEVYQRRSQLHLEMKNWNAAIEDWQQIQRLVESDTSATPDRLSPPVVWNSLAYMRALANQDLDKALEEVNLALAQHAHEPAYLDTRGYIYYRLGKYGKALEDLDRAVELARESRTKQFQKLAALRYYLIDLRPLVQLQQEIERHYAVILYHRAIVQDLFDADKAQQDYAELQQLGFTPGPDLF